ncbi:MAG: hypothetical protein FWC27_12170 [Firmicutes bacterium]|nr:hypothetical protein [Bacillota bacterium]
MKRSALQRLPALLLALLLGLCLPAGCGAQDPETPETPGATTLAADPTEAPPAGPKTIDEDYFSYAEAGGWYADPDGTYSLQNDGLGATSDYMDINWKMMEPEELIERHILFAFSDAVRGDDVTAAGITYTVMESEYTTFLVAPLKDASKGSLEIRLHGVSVENAMPVLETIKLK